MLDFYNLIPQLDWQKVTSLSSAIDRIKLNFDAILIDNSKELLGDEGCEELFLVLKDREKIMGLSIGSNEIGEAGAIHLSSLLQQNDSLSYFQLYNNNLGELPGMEAFAQALSINKTLVALQLANNQIKPEGAVLLARELELNNRTLLILDLSMNQIQNEGAKAFGKAIKLNDILTSLLLGNNEIGDEGCAGLLEGLKVNYSLAVCDVSENVVGETSRNQLEHLLERNIDTLKSVFKYANNFAKSAPLRKAKICFIGKDGSGKTGVIRALMNKPYTEGLEPTAGAKVTQVQARLNGQPWYRTGRSPTAVFAVQFLSRFANIRLDKEVAEVESAAEKSSIGFAGLRKKPNRRGSVQQRRASITDAKKQQAVTGEDGQVAGTKRSSALASSARQSRRSSVAQSVLNAVLGPEDSKSRRKSVKDLLGAIAQPFRRKFNDLLDDSEFVFYGENERATGEVHGLFAEAELENKFEVNVMAKARRERDYLGFNLVELSGNRVFYSLHHALLSEESVYVLVFDMFALVNEDDEDSQKDTIRYLNYWLKVVKYHSPNAALALVATHADEVDKDGLNKTEHYLSRLVFPEMHKMNAAKKEALKVNEAISAANEYAKLLEQEAQQANEGKDEADQFVDKKTNLLINEADRRLFFPVDLVSTKGIDKLRLAIDTAAQKQKYFAQKVPVKWLKFLDALRSDSELLYCLPNRVKALAYQHLENPDVEMAQALELFNEVGYIVHITQIEQLNDTVITDTLKFHNQIFKLVFSNEIASFDIVKAKASGLEEDLGEVLKSGIISQALIDFLWDKSEDEKKFLLKYAQFTLMMSQYKYGHTNKYLVPSLVPASPILVRDTLKNTGNGLDLICTFSFRGFLTLGVYERLVCLCIQYSGNQEGSKEPILAMGWSQHSFGDNYLFRLERQADDIVLQLLEAKKSPAKLVTNFDKMFERLKQFLGKGFLWEAYVLDKEGNKVKFNDAKRQKVTKWFAN